MKEGARAHFRGAAPARALAAGGDARGMVCAMLPLAVSGPTYIGTVVVAAVLFLWWLLRSNAREEAAEQAEARARREGGE
jgi:hypothetical protein